MKKKRALSASRMPDDYDSVSSASGQIYTIRDPSQETNNITLLTGSEEMLKITRDGFWVRGQKVQQDDREAQLVYNAFREFLVYHSLTRNY